ncbi:MAG: LysM peptidoglycan-binding domain-containing protein [Desulfobacula sp.]|jgi:LysM repeat protein
MKLKENPEPKVPATKTNTKKLSEIPGSDKKTDTSILKKNEFAMILVGALLLTLIVFFFFFRTSEPVSKPSPENPSVSSSHDLENRIGKIEIALQGFEKSSSLEGSGIAKEKAGINPLEERVARLETAFSVKMESMIERMGKIEKHIAQLSAKPEVTSDVAGPKPVPVAATPEKKVVKKEKKETIFHTVQKGETLFSISRKYNLSVDALRKLNNLSSDAAIFPGNNILVK